LENKKRLHFGVILSNLENTCQHDIWNGIVDFARRNDIHLTAYPGTYQTTTYDIALHYETIYEIIADSHSLDGVIVLSGFISYNMGNEELEEYTGRLRKQLPLVSVSYVIPGVPSVLIDNISGLYDAVDHLIKTHKKSRIAFVKGPDGHPEAEDRLLGY
jgi:DNA-binding LacI/PurR family transcriptional regulator